MSVTESALLDALKKVIDPNTGKDFVSGKQVKNLRIDGGDVAFDVELGYPAKSLFAGFRKELIAAARGVAGVDNVSVNLGSKVVAHAVQRGVQLLPKVKNIVAVASGKGGVGKSTTAVNLALALAAEGAAVGILDADIYGPSQPMMMGISAKPESSDGKTMDPLRNHGIEVMSIGFLIAADNPMVWRGPMATQALETLAGARGMPRQHAPATKGWAPPAAAVETTDTSPLALLPMPARPANIRWMGGHGAARGATPRLPLDHVLKRPDDAYSAAIDALRARLSEMLDGIEPATLLISGLEKGVGATTLAGNLAFAFASEGRSVALVDANPGKAGLTLLALANTRTRTIRLLGREHEALVPQGALANGPFIIPFEARRRMAKPALAGKTQTASLILIDGPEVGSDEIGRLAIDRAVDGVIVALPAHVDPADPALAAYLRERFGDALIGTVARAA